MNLTQLRQKMFKVFALSVLLLNYPALAMAATEDYSYLRFGLGYKWAGVSNQLGDKLVSISHPEEPKIVVGALPKSCHQGKGVTSVSGLDVQKTAEPTKINLAIQIMALDVGHHIKVGCGTSEFNPIVYFEASKDLTSWVIVDTPSDSLLMKFYFKYVSNFMKRMNDIGDTTIYRAEQTKKGATEVYFDKSRQYTALLKNGEIYLAIDADRADKRDWYVDYSKSKGLQTLKVGGDDASKYRFAVKWGTFDNSNFLAQYSRLHSEALDFKAELLTRYLAKKYLN